MVTAIRPGMEILTPKDVRQTPLPVQALTVNGATSVALPLVGTILRLYLQFTIQYDVAASPAEAEDSFARLVQEVDIRDGKGFSYFSVHSGKLLQWKSNFHAGRNTFWSATPLGTTVANDQTAQINGIVDFGLSPAPNGLKDLDPRAGILTKEQNLSELTMRIRLGAAAALGTAYTIDFVNLVVTPVVVLHGTPSHARMMNAGVVRPQYRSVQHAIAGAAAALGNAHNLPTGFMLTRSLMVVEDPDASNNRDNVQLTEVAYEDNLAGQRPWTTNFQDYERQLNNVYGFLPSGVALINWGGVVQHPGLSRVRRGETEDRLLFTTTGNVNVQLLHKGYSHY